MRLIPVFFILITIWLISSDCLAEQCVRGNGTPKTITRDVRSFTSIELDATYTVTIQTNAPYSITITGDENILPYVQTDKKAGTLIVSSLRSICYKTPLSVKISLPELKMISANGADHTSINLIDNVKLFVTAGGASSLFLTGNTTHLEANVTGQGHLNAQELIADKVTISANESSSAVVNAQKDLFVECHDVSEINFLGSVSAKNVAIHDLCEVNPL